MRALHDDVKQTTTYMHVTSPIQAERWQKTTENDRVEQVLPDGTISGRRADARQHKDAAACNVCQASMGDDNRRRDCEMGQDGAGNRCQHTTIRRERNAYISGA